MKFNINNSKQSLTIPIETTLPVELIMEILEWVDVDGQANIRLVSKQMKLLIEDIWEHALEGEAVIGHAIVSSDIKKLDLIKILNVIIKLLESQQPNQISALTIETINNIAITMLGALYGKVRAMSKDEFEIYKKELATLQARIYLLAHVAHIESYPILLKLFEEIANMNLNDKRKYIYENLRLALFRLLIANKNLLLLERDDFGFVVHDEDENRYVSQHFNTLKSQLVNLAGIHFSFNLYECYLGNLRLVNAYLGYANFCSAHIKNIIFNGANLHNAIFAETDWHGVNSFVGANLSDVRIGFNKSFCDANLIMCDANLTRAEIGPCAFKKFDLTNANMSSTKISFRDDIRSFWQCNFYNLNDTQFQFIFGQKIKSKTEELVAKLPLLLPANIFLSGSEFKKSLNVLYQRHVQLIPSAERINFEFYQLLMWFLETRLMALDLPKKEACHLLKQTKKSLIYRPGLFQLGSKEDQEERKAFDKAYKVRKENLKKR